MIQRLEVFIMAELWNISAEIEKAKAEYNAERKYKKNQDQDDGDRDQRVRDTWQLFDDDDGLR